MFYTVSLMRQKNYVPLDNEHNVLALLQQGYAFIEVGSQIICTQQPIQAEGTAIYEAIPHTELLTDKDYILLSQFLKGAPNMNYGVDSSYFSN